MSEPELLTPRELQLLKAVRAVLDLPRPAAGHYFGRSDAVRERVARLLGATDCVDMADIVTLIRITSIIASLDDIAASPLGYKPDPENSLSVSDKPLSYTVSYQT